MKRSQASDLGSLIKELRQGLVIGTTGSLSRNSLWMILSRFGAQGLTVIFTIVVARRLGSTGFGEFAFIAALTFVANSLTTFGTDMVLIREIASRGDLSHLPAALVLQLVLSSLLIVGIWFFGAWIPNQSADAILALRIYTFSLIPLAFFTIFSTALRGKQRLDAYAILNFIVAASLAGFSLMPGLDLVRLSIYFLAVQIVTAVAAGWMCARILPSFRWPRNPLAQSLSSLLKACAPLALLTVLGMTYQRLGIYLLSTMTSAAATGIFSAASRAVEASKTVHLAVFAALYPAMALAGNHWVDQKDLIRSIHFSRDILLAGGIIASLILFVLAAPLISLLYGSAYLTSVPILRILCWTLIPFTVNSYLTLSFVASNREMLVARALAVSLLGSLILNLWLIPAQGPVGSAWAALTAECLQSAILLVGTQSHSVIKRGAHELPDLPG